jgi:phosphatidylglycerophosphate synthase
MVPRISHGSSATAVQTDAVTGLLAQMILLAALATTTGLGPAGWLAGLAYALALAALVRRALDRAGTRFGPADWVTQARAVLVGGVTALTADTFFRDPPVGVLVTLVAVALSLDWVDGQVARRTGTASSFGWHFDMEVDSFLVFVLSVYAAGTYGPWVLALGSMRYAFGAAGAVLPWMRAQLPPRYWRKPVAAVQGVALVVAVAGVLPSGLTRLGLLLAVVLLLESFGRDVRWLWHRRHATTRSVVRVGSAA